MQTFLFIMMYFYAGVNKWCILYMHFLYNSSFHLVKKTVFIVAIFYGILLFALNILN